MRRVAVAVVISLLVLSCASGPAEDEVVLAITDDSLLPALGGSSAAALTLAEVVDRVCADPGNMSLEEIADAWSGSKGEWGEAWLTTWFGPADMLRTLSRVDYQPISEPGIEELLASSETLDADYVTNQAASTQRGLGAIEYLIFHYSGEADPERRCELLTATVEVVAAETAALEQAWAVSHQGGASFAESFAGESMPSNDALGELVSAVVETLKQQTLFQLGKAIGVSAPEPVPDAIPEGRAGAAADFYRAQLEAIRSMLEAGGPDSLGNLIAARSQEIADRIDSNLDEALAELEEIEGPMRQMAVEEPQALLPLYEALADLLATFESDVVSLLDVTLGFSDTDGDTG